MRKIVNIDTSASTFSNILLINPAGAVIASIGDTIPIYHTKDVVPMTAESQEVFTLLLLAESQTKQHDPKGAKIRTQEAALQAQRSAKPLPVEIAGKSYVAYFRPIKFDGDTDAPMCQPLEDGAKSGNQSEDGAVSTLGAPGTHCLLIGLVPEGERQAWLIWLSPDLLTLFALMLALAIVLVPVTKLRFLGPAGHMSQLEVGTVFFGLVAAVAIVTLGALAMFSSVKLHAESKTSIKDVAHRMAVQFHSELEAAIRQPIWLPTVRKTNGIPVGSPAVYEQIECRFADNKQIQVNHVALEPGHMPFWLLPRSHPAASGDGVTDYFAWPKRELTMAFGEQGRAFPGYPSLADRCHAGARSDISARRYLGRAMRGETDGTLPDNEKPKSCNQIPAISIDKRYTIAAVRAQTDGVTKVVVVNRFSKDSKDSKHSLRPCGEPPIRTRLPDSLEYGPR